MEEDSYSCNDPSKYLWPFLMYFIHCRWLMSCLWKEVILLDMLRECSSLLKTIKWFDYCSVGFYKHYWVLFFSEEFVSFIVSLAYLLHTSKERFNCWFVVKFDSQRFLSREFQWQFHCIVHSLYLHLSVSAKTTQFLLMWSLVIIIFMFHIHILLLHFIILYCQCMKCEDRCHVPSPSAISIQSNFN